MFRFYEYLWSLVQLVTHYNVVTVQNWKIKKKTLIAILHASCFFLMYYWVNDIDISATLSILCSLRSHRYLFKCHSKYFCNKFVYSIWNGLSHQSNRIALKQRKLRFNYSTAYAQLDSRLGNENNTKKYSKEWSKKNYPVWIFLLHFYHSSIFLFIFFHGICQIYKKAFIFFRFFFKKLHWKKSQTILKRFFSLLEADKRIIINATYQVMLKEAQATTRRIVQLQNEINELTEKTTVQIDTKNIKK